MWSIFDLFVLKVSGTLDQSPLGIQLDILYEILHGPVPWVGFFNVASKPWIVGRIGPMDFFEGFFFWGIQQSRSNLTGRGQCWGLPQRFGTMYFLKVSDKIGHCWVWQYGLWSFQTGGTKLKWFLPKNQHNSKEIIEFWELG